MKKAIRKKFCRVCGKLFESETKFRRVCDPCKEKSRKRARKKIIAFSKIRYPKK